MRRFILYILVCVLAGLVLARALIPEPTAAEAAAVYGYNVLDAGGELPPETAGSAVIDGMRAYFLSRTPTAKSAMTGAAAGYDLIVVLAENWTPDPSSSRKNPAFVRFARHAAQVGGCYRPDWGQGLDGRVYALLTGLVPVRVGDGTVLDWVGREGTYLPFSLAGAFTAAGAATYAFAPTGLPYAAWAALGFRDAVVCAGTAAETVATTAALYMAGDAPFFAFYVFADEDADDGLKALMDALDEAGRSDDTVVCLSVAAEGSLRGGLYLWGGPVSDAAADVPCSETDVTPTLLNLFGLAYDARLLSGRDVYAGNGLDGEIDAAMPLVTLSDGPSADWLTLRGGYLASQSLFWPYDDGFADEAAVTDYVWRVNAVVSDRYEYARRILETNYFRLAFG